MFAVWISYSGQGDVWFRVLSLKFAEHKVAVNDYYGGSMKPKMRGSAEIVCQIKNIL